MNFRLASSTEAVEKHAFPPCVKYREALLHQEAPGMPRFGRGIINAEGRGGRGTRGIVDALLSVLRGLYPGFAETDSDIFFNGGNFKVSSTLQILS